MVDSTFTKRLPKIELHAHLTGSITRECLHEVWMQRKLEDPALMLQDPLEVMPPGKVWDIRSFFPLFSTYIYALCSTSASLIYCTRSVLRNFEEDGVRYLELRSTPRAMGELDKESYVATVLACINDCNRDRLSAFLILSIDRGNTPEEAMEVVDLAIKYHSQGVVGIDLCGDPSKGDVEVFRAAFAEAKLHQLRITLHFAEIPASATINELETLLSFQPDRLGHVIHTPEHIKEEIRRRNIGLELCISCNVQAKLIEGGVADHHFGYWENTDCPVALCTDDVGVFCSSLSTEYLLVAQAFGFNQVELLALCSRAVDAIFGEEEEKARLRRAISVMRVQCGL